VRISYKSAVIYKMILGPKLLLKLVKEQKLVEGLSERELTSPEGAGFDLRLGEVYEISGGVAFLGVEERQTPEIKLVVKHEKGKKNKITIKPGEFYLVTTMEKVNTPLDLTINFKPRTTTFRSGLHLRTGNVAPGYKGKLTFALKNDGPIPVTMEMGCRFVHAQFYRVDGGGNQYKGQWQGGRVTTKKREKQI
jgi:deoxycytidine triphosphate deaminase